MVAPPPATRLVRGWSSRASRLLLTAAPADEGVSAANGPRIATSELLLAFLLRLLRLTELVRPRLLV